VHSRAVQRRVEQLVARCVDLYDHAPAGYLVVGAGRQLISVNAVAAELLGRRKDHLVGRRVSDVVARHDRARFDEFWERTTRGDEHVSCEVDLRHASGEFVTTACHVRRSVELSCWIVALIDVTDLHEARRVAQHRVELEERSEVAQHLYDSIRQRLFGITVMIEVAGQARETPPTVQRSLDRIHGELAAIITDIREIIFGEVGVNPPRSGGDPPEGDPTPRAD
jgi:PAS domain S-box-containing protein